MQRHQQHRIIALTHTTEQREQ